ncbi:MAG TPA: transcriptional repressor [Anaerohalosphaeraceae bacterium]|nr:transcriptional repressor [Phycisphaerae bacterium]HOK95684.1 transcriptional repressor [Anaerohalosphaeraceae bacterium]HOL32249.1 transcriptional repressor [Anaerohalosphaeraceae bacterium]HOM76301.1 transcriptional repressor [Anaerohalosphaeraceae bacterium]HPC64491.1 transcriptional repressor [Anaerohalosphaeraceae bacterium]
MDKEEEKIRIDKKIAEFKDKCRLNGLRITPQRLAIYKALVETKTHPTAEEVYSQVQKEFSNISLDTVNRTLLTLSEIGAAFIVEGTGQPRRYDGGLENHQHFRCIKCGTIMDFYYEPYDKLDIPDYLQVTVLRKTVYLEGLCGICSGMPAFH